MTYGAGHKRPIISHTYNSDGYEGLHTGQAHVYPIGKWHVGYFDTQYGILEDGRKSISRSVKPKQQRSGNFCKIKTNQILGNWDDQVMPVEFWTRAYFMTMNQIIFGINYLHRNIRFVTYDWTDKPPKREEYKEFLVRNPVGYIIWDKCNGESDFSDCELIWTSFPEKSYIKRFMWNGMLQASDAENGTIMQGNKRLNQQRIHPTEKPILLNRWFLKKYMKPGQSLVDTHSGSQSMRIAAWQEGINYVGYETKKIYFDDGNKRFALEQQQIRLFY